VVRNSEVLALYGDGSPTWVAGTDACTGGAKLYADYVGRVFSSTSHLRLRISYLPEFDPDKEVLNIDLNHETGEFECEYQETAAHSTSGGEANALRRKHFPYSIASCDARNGFRCVSPQDASTGHLRTSCIRSLLHTRAPVSTVKRRKTSCHAFKLVLFSPRIEPGSLKPLRHNPKEGARTERSMRPQFFLRADDPHIGLA
jgi:hypothetical protein